MNLEHLTYPWIACVPNSATASYCWVQDATGNMNLKGGITSANIAAVEFAATARWAFDIMMRRSWEAERWLLEEGKPWGVDSAESALPDELTAMRWPDPFTALVEAERWYVANVEGKDNLPDA